MSKLTEKQIEKAQAILKEQKIDVVFVVVKGEHMYSQKENALYGNTEDDIEAVFASDEAKARYEEENKSYEQKLADDAKADADTLAAEAKAKADEAERVRLIEEENAAKRKETESLESQESPETESQEDVKMESPEDGKTEEAPLEPVVETRAAKQAQVVPISQGKKKK